MWVALVMLALSVVLPAQTRSRKAHEHGSAKLNIAFESAHGAPRGVMEFESPAESVVGFEHQPATPADKAKLTAALDKLKSRIAEMVLFPAASACRITAKSASLQAESHAASSKAAKQEQHAEVRAEFDIACAKPLAGAEIRFGFTRVFPAIHDVAVALLAGEQQLSADVENDKGVLKIAK